MKILALSPHLPWPLYGGNMVRIYGILRELATRGHDIVLLAGSNETSIPDDHPVKLLCREVRLYRPPNSAGQKNAILAAFASVVSPLPYTAAKFGSGTVAQRVREIIESDRFDMILANYAFMAYLIPPHLAKQTPVVLDEHESEGLLWRQYLRMGGFAKRAFALLNLAKMSWFQKAMSSRIVALMSASEREATFTRTFLPPNVKLWTVPNGVDTDFFSPAVDEEDGHSIVLCGGFGVYRNCEAAIWFVKDVLPRVQAEIPEAEFWIVGSSPPPEVRELEKHPGVHVTGTVDDIRPYYARAAVSVAPYRYGEGTKLKVLEAMASGVAVVSTTIGCQGINVRDGEHILVADNAEAFTDSVVALLRNKARRREIGAEGRSVIEREYSWSEIIGGLEPKLVELVRERQGAVAAEVQR